MARIVRQSEATPRRSQMRREEATERILEAKREKGLTFSQLAEKVGRPKVWTTAALLGQHPMSAEEAQVACDVLGLGAEVAAALQEIPIGGSLDSTFLWTPPSTGFTRLRRSTAPP